MMNSDDNTTLSDGREISFRDIVRGLQKRRRVLLSGALVGVSISVAWIAWEKPSYVSVAVVTTSAASRVAGGLGGLASQLGIGLQGSAQSGTIVPTADLLEEIVRSDTLAQRIVNDSLLSPDTIRGSGGPLTGISQTSQRRETSGVRSRAARERVLRRAIIKTEKNPFTGSVSIRVSATSAVDAREINRSLVRQLNQYIIDLGQEQALEEKKFITGRIKEREQLLALAEDRLSTFLKQNKSYRESADLAFQYDRLNRTVVLNYSVLASLQQAMEDASVRAARNTPVLTALQSPTTPSQPVPRRYVLRIVSGFIAGGAVALLGALVVSLFRTVLAETSLPEV